jgi:hypothetical protein
MKYKKKGNVIYSFNKSTKAYVFVFLFVTIDYPKLLLHMSGVQLNFYLFHFFVVVVVVFCKINLVN